jgi:hypothetical protein
MNRTPARSQFKSMLGQANHYLVTAEIALFHLAKSDVDHAPNELRTSWNPKDKAASISRTRTFIREAALGRAVDALDVYASLLNRAPDVLQDEDVKADLCAAKRSVYKKLSALTKHYEVKPVTRALVFLLVTWRNNVLHELAENVLEQDICLILSEHADDIGREYRGLIPNSLPAKAMSGGQLTFKETTSLIRAAHNFVQEVDESIVRRLDLPNFIAGVVAEELTKPGAWFLQKIRGVSDSRREGFLRTWLMNRWGAVVSDPRQLETALRLCARDVAGSSLESETAALSRG